MFAILIHGRDGRARIHPTIYTIRKVAEVAASNLQKDEIYHAEMSGDSSRCIYTEITEVNPD